jgi:hypothetical protein
VNAMSTPRGRRLRRTAAVGAGVAGAAVAAAVVVMAASGARAADDAPSRTTAVAAPSPSSSAQSDGALAVAAIWADVDPADRRVLCTAFLINPDGAWQAMAPALADEGVTRTDAFAFFGRACVADQDPHQLVE